MKKLIIFFITIILCLGITACGGKQAQSSQATATPTTTAATTAPTTSAAMENPLGFDPNHPEGWSVGEQDKWQEWQDWMTSKDLPIADNDYSIGDFDLIMPLKDARKYFPSKPLSEITKNKDAEYGGFPTKRITFDSITLFFVQIGKGEPFDLSDITITGKEYVTPRGLRVGDSAEKLYELYGVPIEVSKNEWIFATETGDYQVFHAIVVNGAVQKMILNSIM